MYFVYEKHELYEAKNKPFYINKSGSVDFNK